VTRTFFIFAFVFLAVCGESLDAQVHEVNSGSVEMISVSHLKSMIAGDSGNVVLVNAWATWCKPCKEEMPNLLRLNKVHKNDPFKFILVSADDFDQLDTVVKPMLKSLGVGFTTYIVNDSSDNAFISGMNADWNGALPTSFIYSKEGKLMSMLTGERSYEQFEKAVAGLLREPGHDAH
jgi:thiol-disulfide isomerase/thioredoxin